MTSQHFATTEQSDVTEATVIVFWGEQYERPNLLIGVVPTEGSECEACSEPTHPLRIVSLDMDDTIAEAFELAVAKWREHAETAARKRHAEPDENGSDRA